jgi:hypothetical protein
MNQGGPQSPLVPVSKVSLPVLCNFLSIAIKKSINSAVGEFSTQNTTTLNKFITICLDFGDFVIVFVEIDCQRILIDVPRVIMNT